MIGRGVDRGGGIVKIRYAKYPATYPAQPQAELAWFTHPYTSGWSLKVGHSWYSGGTIVYDGTY